MVLLGDKLGIYKAMAKAYPRSSFIGFDYHKLSILTARKRAKDAGLKNVTFVAAKSTNYPGNGYDFVSLTSTVCMTWVIRSALRNT